MCAIIGGVFPNLTEDSIALIKALFYESQIRGKHATGISYIDGGVVTIKEPIPAIEFIRNLDLKKFLYQRFSFVGHCRYSTSHLEYNQPIANEELSIVHNGVITQEPFEKWECLFGHEDFLTKNDSELVFKSHLSGSHPLVDFPDASMAVCGLNKNELFFYRNGKRPIHWGVIDDNLIVSSTRDIIKRCSSSANVFDAMAGYEYFIDEKGVGCRKSYLPCEDLQQ